MRKGHDLKKLHHLLDELAIINREVNGMIYLGDQVAAPASAPTAPAQSAEVIEPKDEAPAGSAQTSEPEADAAESTPTKETEDTADSKKSDGEVKASSKKGKK